MLFARTAHASSAPTWQWPLPPRPVLQIATWTFHGHSRGTAATNEEKLVQWVKRNGGQADVRLGAAAAGSPRGVLAERSFRPHEVIVSIPSHLTVPFEGSPEEACVLLLHMMHDKEKQQQYRPWLATLPGPEEFVPWDQLDDEALSLLQSPEMEGAIRERRQWLEAVWNKSVAPIKRHSKQQLLTAQGIGNEVQWAANVVRSRNWTVGETSSGAPIGVMQPLLDMINHDRTSPNTLRYNGDSFQLVHEGEGIAAGEEITYSYEGPCHELRNDQAAMDYCFMLPLAKDPRLFHVDAIAAQCAGMAEDGFGAATSAQLEGEQARLEAVLAQFPTSLAEDRALIASMHRDGKTAAEVFMVEIRAARKAALEARMNEALSAQCM